MTPRRLTRLLAALAPPLAAAGCASTPTGPILPNGSALAWPSPPDAPRIRFVGQLVGEASLGRQPQGLDALRAVLAGPPRTVGFVTPTAVAVAGERLFVADPSHPDAPMVHLLDLSARTYAQIREVGGRRLVWPVDVALRGGRLAIADARQGAVFVTDLQGRLLSTMGTGLLQRPAAVAWCGEGELAVLDAAAHAFFVFDSGGSQRLKVGGRGGATGSFNFPAGLCAVGERTSGVPFAFVVADSMNFRVQLFDARGDALLAFGRKGDAAGDFALPRDVAVDSDGHVYVLDNQFENVQVFDAQGRLLMALGQEGREAGEFNLPGGITIDERDRIWIADTYNRRVQVFQYLRDEVQQ